MKRWKCTFFRYNPQLRYNEKYGANGYEKIHYVEARTEKSAWNKAEKEYGKCLYGGMWLKKVELAEAEP